MDQSDFTREQIKKLFDAQKLGVLSTQGQGQPYASLIAFAAGADLAHLYFATTRATRKFDNLTRHPQAAMLVDNRSNSAADFRQAMAVTAVGLVSEVAVSEKEAALELYLAKNPQLEEFVSAPTSAFLALLVERYFLVTSFQNVSELTPV